MNQQQPASMQTCQIIATALMMGVAMFAGIALFMTSGGEAEVVDQAANEEFPIMLVVLSVMGVSFLGARYVVLRVQDRQLGKLLDEVDSDDVDSQNLIGLFQTRMIISLAMLEGIAFFSLVLFIVEADWMMFLIAMIMLAWMGVNFPTNNKFHAWVNASSGKNPFGGEE
ncbi:MAG: hypothetical protein HUJ26_14645 [Planctomycetaceae bacterium]|nr:hypothetical protein [Planctomycetaceae bacterium]